MNREMIYQSPLNTAYRKIGSITCFSVFGLGLFYALITLLGLWSLPSSNDPIGDPYFTLMEVLSILIALFMAVSMVAVHFYAEPDDQFYSLTALVFMFLAASITSCVHFLILSLNYGGAYPVADYPFFFSFKWPSVVYALDILAWDLFFSLSVLFAVPVFKQERTLKLLLILSGVLGLTGLLGVPLQNMQIRNIGIVGYAGIGPWAFLWLGKILGRAKPSPRG